MKKRKMVCSERGSEKVMRDSWAVWDFAKQEWALYNVFDDAWCDQCEGECSIEEIETDEEE